MQQVTHLFWLWNGTTKFSCNCPSSKFDPVHQHSLFRFELSPLLSRTIDKTSKLERKNPCVVPRIAVISLCSVQKCSALEPRKKGRLFRKAPPEGAAIPEPARMIGNLAKLSYVRGVSQAVASGCKAAAVPVKLETKPAVAGQTPIVASSPNCALPRSVVRVVSGVAGYYWPFSWFLGLRAVREMYGSGARDFRTTGLHKQCFHRRQ